MFLKIKNKYQNIFYLVLCLLFGCSLLLPRVILAQNFIEGINIYNRGQFDYLVSRYGPDFLKNHHTEKGLANYFIAESYYNLAIEQRDAATATNYFKNAWSGFQMAQSDRELKRTYPEFYLVAKYKKAWCSFKLAELGVEPRKKFEQAYNEFMAQLHDETADSLAVFALLMAAESKTLQCSEIFMEQLDQGVEPEQLTYVLNSYQLIKGLYNQIFNLLDSTFFKRSESFKEVVLFKKTLLNFAFSKIYRVSAEGFENTLTVARKSNYQRLAIELLNEFKPDSLLGILARRSQVSLKYIAYLNLEKLLNNYFLTNRHNDKNKFLMAANSKFGKSFNAEVFYKQATLYQANPDIQSDELTHLAIINYDLAKAIPESHYWNGLQEMINGDYDKSRESFSEFLTIQNRKPKVSRREAILVEDATYQKYLLDFEEFYLSDNVSALKRLAAFIDDFKPQNRIVKERTEQLKLLANCSLSANRQQIWRNVLSGTEDEKLDQALATVRFVLPRAALNIGRVREKYLRLLAILLRITGQKRGDESLFYRGIVKSLEAEIEPTPFDKIEKFEEAAAILKSVSPNFENRIEAEYIRGRCLFFADNFEEAKAVLIPLVNEQNSLRALFYVGEMFRLDGFGRAAKACYSAIISYKERDKHNFNGFWLANAKAGLEAADDSGELAIIDSIAINSIVYRPAIHNELLTYEKLAEEKFLKKRLAQATVLWQLCYGLPIKNIYLSRNRLSKTLAAPGNYYDAMSGFLDEVQGKITTSLALNVILPPGIVSNVEVSLGGKALKNNSNFYVERRIPLHSELELDIENPDCYEFSIKYKFSKPGKDKKTVRLNKKRIFSFSKKEKSLFKDYNYFFGKRRDDNYTLHRIPKTGMNSELVRDFNNLIELRDCTLDTINQRFLAVNAKENRIWEYSWTGKRTGNLPLQQTMTLNSPEGIAVFGNGEIFVADWGNHRIVHLSANGNLLGEIGTRKANGVNQMGTPINLRYPTRLFVPALNKRVMSDEYEFVQDYLYVADQSGIHVIKTDGTYLDTLVETDDKFGKGEFYGFFTEELQSKSKLYVLHRLNSSPGKLFEFVSN